MLYEYLKEHILKSPYKKLISANENVTYYDFIMYTELCGKHLEDGKYGILCNSKLNTVKALFACFVSKNPVVVFPHDYENNYIKTITDNISLSHIITDNGIIKVSDNKNKPENLNNTALIIYFTGLCGEQESIILSEENLISDINTAFDNPNIIPDNIIISHSLNQYKNSIKNLLIAFVRGKNIIFNDD